MDAAKKLVQMSHISWYLILKRKPLIPSILYLKSMFSSFMMELVTGFSAFAKMGVYTSVSLRSSLTCSSRKSIRSLYKHYVADGGEQIATFLPVQKQPDGHSCGPFAIVYAAEILDGRSPSEVVFDVNKMREHLNTYLEMQRLTPFPKISNQ